MLVGVWMQRWAGAAAAMVVGKEARVGKKVRRSGRRSVRGSMVVVRVWCGLMRSGDGDGGVGCSTVWVEKERLAKISTHGPILHSFLSVHQLVQLGYHKLSREEDSNSSIPSGIPIVICLHTSSFDQMDHFRFIKTMPEGGVSQIGAFDLHAPVDAHLEPKKTYS